MDSRGFKRTALSLMVIITITVVAFGVYLYFNFTSRSSLPVIVPAKVEQFVHFQTRKFRDDFASAKPSSYIDSISNLVGSWAIFSHCDKPAEPGIALFSDVVYFKTKEARFLAFTLTSEELFSAFCDTLKKQNLISNKMDLGTYNLVKIVGSPVYFAFKHKVLVFAKPNDSTVTDEALKYALKDVFSGRSDGFITNSGLQSLYDADAQFIVYDSRVSEKISGFRFQPKEMPAELIVSLNEKSEPKKQRKSVNSPFVEIYKSLGQEFPSPENQIETMFKGVFNTLKSDTILK
jgi:hypothetical protein